MTWANAFASCSSCGAAIQWIKTKNDKSMPVDVAETECGNCSGSGFVAGGECDKCGGSGRVRLSHFATCPNADKHRKPRAK